MDNKRVSDVCSGSKLYNKYIKFSSLMFSSFFTHIYIYNIHLTSFMIQRVEPRNY